MIKRKVLRVETIQKLFSSCFAKAEKTNICVKKEKNLFQTNNAADFVALLE